MDSRVLILESKLSVSSRVIEFSSSLEDELSPGLRNIDMMSTVNEDFVQG